MALAPYQLKFSEHQEALDFIDKVADMGIAQHTQDTFESAQTYERWENSGYNPERYLVNTVILIFSSTVMANLWITK